MLLQRGQMARPPVAAEAREVASARRQEAEPAEQARLLAVADSKLRQERLLQLEVAEAAAVEQGETR